MLTRRDSHTSNSACSLPEAQLDYGDTILSFDDTPEGLMQLWDYRTNLLETKPQALINYLFYKQNISDEKKNNVLAKLALLKNISTLKQEERPIILLSDIDNTYVPHTIKRSRDPLHDNREKSYPGINQLYCALLEGLKEASDSPPSRIGSKLAFLTARPGNPISRHTGDPISNTTKKITTELLESTGIASNKQLILWGTPTDFLPTLGAGNFYERVRRNKLANFDCMTQIYAGYNFIFFGDNGEADLEVAQAIYESYKFDDILIALFIHNVKGNNFSDEEISTYREQNIFIYSSVIRAATIAAKEKFISIYQALDITLRTIEETKCRYEDDRVSVHTYNLRLNETIDDLKHMHRELTTRDRQTENHALLSGFASFATSKKLVTPEKKKLPRADSFSNFTFLR